MFETALVSISGLRFKECWHPALTQDASAAVATKYATKFRSATLVVAMQARTRFRTPA
jgi:hypothetical protein